MLDKPTPMRRVLHIFTCCGQAGTETVLRTLIEGLAQAGIESAAYFQRDIGGGDLFRALCPTHFEADGSLESVIAAGRFDAINAVSSTMTMDVPRAVARARFAGPVIVSCHGDYITGWNRCNANRVVALTRWWAARIEPYTDLPIEVIGNPVDTKRFRPPEAPAPSAKPIIGWVGRSEEHGKNVERLKRIMAALPAGVHDFQVVDGTPQPDAAALFGPLSDRVGWYGRLPGARMPEFYRGIAASRGALLVTSDQEAFPMVGLEAMASGCPVVVPDAWGSEEMVEHGETGFIYARANDVADAAACLRRLLEPECWGEAAVRARERAERLYSVGAIARRYMDALADAEAHPRQASPVRTAAWALRTWTFYGRKPPAGVSHYRVRLGGDAFERALQAHRAGSYPESRRALLVALRRFPLVFTKAWRVRFLLRTLLLSRS